MQPLTFVIMGRDQTSSQEIKQALQASGRARVLADCDGQDKMLAEVIRLRPSAAILILDASNPEKEFAFISKLAGLHPGTAIIAAAPNASPALILGSMRAGVNEFLQIPLIPDEFQTVLKRVAELRKEEQSTSKSARVIAVFSGKGGAGVSFLGTNLAAAVGAPTVLVDLNLQAGDAASFLGLDPKYSLADFARNRSRLDDSLITSMLTVHSPHLSLVAAPNEAHEAEEMRPEDIPEILHLLGQKFQCIVLDLPHTFDPITVAALDLADDILLTLTLDIPGIRSTKRALKVFDRLGYPRQKVSVVVNRWAKSIDVELHKVEGHLGERLIGFVPNDYRKVMDSINLGRPLVDSDPASKIALEIKRIAASLVAARGETSQPQRRKGLFRSVFGRQGSTSAIELSTLPDNA